MRGYFGVGVDGISKPMNLGNLVRIAHAFDASFFFSIAPRLKLSDQVSDTSRAEGVMPFYHFEQSSDFRLPLGCRLVGVEITEDAVELPRFRHPTRAAYVFGAERYSLSPEVLKSCDFVVKIPTRFSINVGMAGAIGFENVASGFGGVAVVAYFSALTDLRFTAAQYALISAAASVVGRVVTGTTAGGLIEGMGYVNFYLLTTVIALPGVLLFWWMSRSGLVDRSIGTAGVVGEGDAREGDPA